MSDFLNSKLGPMVAAQKVVEDIHVAIDAGSTQTRGAVFTKDAQMGNPLLVDSNYDIIDRDISHVVSPGTDVFSNLLFEVKDVTEGKSDKQFEEITVVKGDLLAALTSSKQVTSSSASKIDQVATYVNIVCNIALLLVDYYTDHGTQEHITVHPVVSLPPEDTKFQHRTETYRKRLSGSYIVKLPRLNVEVAFTIENDLRIISEPEAVAVFATVEGALADEEDSVVCVLDIGGRSAGITFIDNKQLLIDSCVTVPLGGARLLSILGRNIANAFDIQEPQANRLVRALGTGFFKIGSQKLNVTEQLNAAKREFAKMMFNDLMVAIDTNGIQMQNISKVYCSGRTFGEAPDSPSILFDLEKMFKTKSPYTAFVQVDKPNPILYGLTYNGIMYA